MHTQAASPHPVVSQAALSTLSRVRSACGYFEDVAQLLEGALVVVVVVVVVVATVVATVVAVVVAVVALFAVALGVAVAVGEC